MDPAAVLQSGEEACQRIERTAKRDKDAAVGALVAGEIPGAKDAITFLCPEQKPVPPRRRRASRTVRRRPRRRAPTAR